MKTFKQYLNETSNEQRELLRQRFVNAKEYEDALQYPGGYKEQQKARNNFEKLYYKYLDDTVGLSDTLAGEIAKNPDLLNLKIKGVKISKTLSKHVQSEILKHNINLINKIENLHPDFNVLKKRQDDKI